MDDKTTLEDLLKLELHKYEEEVKETVDRAVKEMGMEKFLKELHNTWDILDFGKELHERTKLNVLKIDEETIEMLEENQVNSVWSEILLDCREREREREVNNGNLCHRCNCKACWTQDT